MNITTYTFRVSSYVYGKFLRLETHVWLYVSFMLVIICLCTSFYLCFPVVNTWNHQFSFKIICIFTFITFQYHELFHNLLFVGEF